MRIPLLVAQVVRGFAMGAADIVPGVSGGTVALVVGIYERLIDNVHRGALALKTLVRRDVSGFVPALRQVEWAWLLALLAGILTAVVALSSILETLLDEQPVRMGGLFFGLIAGTIVVAWRMLKQVDAVAIAIVLGVAVVLFLLLGLRSDTEFDSTGAESVTVGLWAFFGAGALAICAMILPGVSGSFLLVMMGMYPEVLGAVNDRAIGSLLVFAVGAVIGLALFSSLLTWLLEHHHDRTLAALIGLMLGSMRVLWPWPGGVSTTTLAAPADDVVVPVLLAILGAVVVIGVDLVSRSRPAHDDAPPVAVRGG